MKQRHLLQISLKIAGLLSHPPLTVQMVYAADVQENFSDSQSEDLVVRVSMSISAYNSTDLRIILIIVVMKRSSRLKGDIVNV